MSCCARDQGAASFPPSAAPAAASAGKATAGKAGPSTGSSSKKRPASDMAATTLTPATQGPTKAAVKSLGGGRKDSHLAGVIISEKRDKKLAKYQADKVPYPFTSREQYERSLRTTVGPEWNTPSTFSELTRPDVRDSLRVLQLRCDVQLLLLSPLLL